MNPATPPLDPSGADPLERTELRCLVGPTAAGKSELALELCERAGAELVSLDSMLVYRGMDVGTAKPGAAMRARVPHHMLDLVEPSERYDVQRFLADLRPRLSDIERRGRRVLFVGGTAFYLKALTHGLFAGPPADLELRARVAARVAAEGGDAAHARLSMVDARAAARIHPNDTRRLVRALEVWEQTGRALSDWQREWGWRPGDEARGRPRRLVGVDRPPAELDARILRRVERMLATGWVEEARAIRAGAGFGPSAVQALGYREVLELADGRLTRDECRELVARRTRRFARRQRTWYGKFPELRWLDAPDAGRALTALGW